MISPNQFLYNTVDTSGGGDAELELALSARGKAFEGAPAVRIRQR